MRPETDGPTIDTFLSTDNTTDIKTDDIDARNTLNRPTKEKPELPFPQWLKWLLGVIGTCAVTGIGAIVYNHSNRLVAEEKDINYIRDEVKDQKVDLKETKDKVININENVDLLKQKIDLQDIRTKKIIYAQRMALK